MPSPQGKLEEAEFPTISLVPEGDVSRTCRSEIVSRLLSRCKHCHLVVKMNSDCEAPEKGSPLFGSKVNCLESRRIDMIVLRVPSYT